MSIRTSLQAFILCPILVLSLSCQKESNSTGSGNLLQPAPLWAEIEINTNDNKLLYQNDSASNAILINIELTNSYGVFDRKVGVYFYEPTELSNNDPVIIGYCEFRLDNSGAGKGIAGSYSTYDNSIPVDFKNHTNLRMFVILDRNQDYSSSRSPNGNDKILVKDIVIHQTTNLIIDAKQLFPFKNGFNSLQIKQLVDMTANLDQSGKENLILEIKHAMNSVQNNPDLINDIIDRESFLVQDAKIAAAYTCTTVARYIFIKAMEMIYPELIVSDTVNFPSYYIHAINQGYVLLGVTTKTFCYVANGDTMLSDYLDSSKLQYWHASRSVYENNTGMLTKLYEDKPEIILIREGDYSGGKHTLVGILDTEGKYYLLDTWYTENNGKLLEDRYGADSKRIIWYIMSYVKK